MKLQKEFERGSAVERLEVGDIFIRHWSGKGGESYTVGIVVDADSKMVTYRPVPPDLSYAHGAMRRYPKKTKYFEIRRVYDNKSV